MIRPLRSTDLLPMTPPAERAAFEARCFEAWMGKVDACLVKRCGMAAADLPDVCYRDMFDDGESPAHAARAALRNARDE